MDGGERSQGTPHLSSRGISPLSSTFSRSAGTSLIGLFRGSAAVSCNRLPAWVQAVMWLALACDW